jgi:hypothetical protein
MATTAENVTAAKARARWARAELVAAEASLRLAQAKHSGSKAKTGEPAAESVDRVIREYELAAHDARANADRLAEALA